MDINTIFVGLIIFLAVFTQSLSGFGVALVAMALLPAFIGIRVATPLVAIVALVLEAVLVYRYRKSIQVGAVWRIALAAVLATPIGVLFLIRVEESITLKLLGIVIAGYALYVLLGLKMPRLEKTVWAYFAGIIGGMLGGAYNTAGPPVILYADCRRWSPDVFKGNLQGYFIIVSLAVAASHAINGNFTPKVWDLFWWSLPFTVIGIIAGLGMDSWLNPATFRRLVLILLVIMGIKLMI